ncbi:MAG: GNAT family N-acetyltransferase [Ferruginibacter sp.]
MEIQHRQAGKGGVFLIEKDNRRIAEMTYTLDSEIMIIEHTVVDASLRGKNIGLQLVNKACEYAKENNLKINPVCTFVQSVFKKNPALYDNVT